ncbi:DUF3017 domain-containing protein [Microbispora bryophytorum]|uniref:DUF3017 domain-containing protein n=1 Tax=Microbispora bryophytorum subsp. camponoti TaxID=1677852 RepID=A0ABR8L647_9ACTN|nr:DUF3017 domain-containing protein [Microbispora camponoti]MBD3143979.1 DUF3017 domain-containing protein [Microbispora camponoti]
MRTSESTAWGPYLLVVAGAAAGLGVIGLGVPVPAGGAIMGCGFLAGSLIRVTVSERRAGALAVRSRRMDALTLAAFGAALVIGSLLMLLRLHDS